MQQNMKENILYKIIVQSFYNNYRVVLPKLGEEFLLSTFFNPVYNIPKDAYKSIYVINVCLGESYEKQTGQILSVLSLMGNF